MQRPDFEKFAAWEREWSRSQPVDYEQNIRFFEAMYEEALSLGVLPPEDPREGIDHKIRLARLLNADVAPRDHAT